MYHFLPYPSIIYSKSSTEGSDPFVEILLLLFGIGDCAQAEAAEGFVLGFPGVGRGLVLELAAGALVNLHLLRRALVEPPPERARRPVDETD